MYGSGQVWTVSPDIKRPHYFKHHGYDVINYSDGLRTYVDKFLCFLLLRKNYLLYCDLSKLAFSWLLNYRRKNKLWTIHFEIKLYLMYFIVQSWSWNISHSTITTLLRRQFAWNVKVYFRGIIRKLFLWARWQTDYILFIFPRKKDLTFYAYCLLNRQFALNVNLFSGENILKCHLLKFLPSMLSIQGSGFNVMGRQLCQNCFASLLKRDLL